MKANAPKKIYLEAMYPDNGVLPNGLNYTSSPTDIEYTRTDAFIEKACTWFLNNAASYVGYYCVYLYDLAKDFRKAMKGE